MEKETSVSIIDESKKSNPDNIESVGKNLQMQIEDDEKNKENTIPNKLVNSSFKSEEDKKKFNDLSFFRIGNNFRTYWPHDTASQEFKIPALYLSEW